MEMDNRPVRDIADMLNAYELAYSRKMTVLACCILIHTALNKHGKPQAKDNERLTRFFAGRRLFDWTHVPDCRQTEGMEVLSRLLPSISACVKLMKNVTPELLLKELKREIRGYLERRVRKELSRERSADTDEHS